jgi:hypothetical protein
MEGGDLARLKVCYPCFHPEKSKKPTENTSQDSPFSGRDSNPLIPEYKLCAGLR